MPKKPTRTTIGTVLPLTVGALAGQEPQILLPPNHVGIYSTAPVIQMIVLLGPDGAQVTGGYARYDRIERDGKRSITDFSGLDPYEMTVDLVFDGFPNDSVEPKIRDLEQLAEIAHGQDEPRLMKIAGPVPHPNLTWRIDGPLREDGEWTIRVQGERVRSRISMTLLQHIADDVIAESVARSRRKGADNGKGSSPHFTKVLAGEDSFSDVSKRLYTTRDKAVALARANNRPIGARLHTGDKIRYA